MAKEKFNMQFVGEDGNAFSLLGRFSRLAKKAGWTHEEIEEVTEKAKSGDYDHLLVTLMDHVNVDQEEY